MRHLLVTNDFPPKVGGIQSYLWELWRRLPPGEVTVLTSPYGGAAEWDARQAHRVERTREPVLLPHPGLVRRVNRLAEEVDADLVVIDPALPLGLIGRHVERPHAVILHGAEVTVPGRLPVARSLLARVLAGARLVIAAGGYPLAEAERAAGRELPSVNVPPGVDIDRFAPPATPRDEIRRRLGLEPDVDLIVSVSRMVPRKGMDRLIDAVAAMRADGRSVQLALAGAGRDEPRLRRRAEAAGAPVAFLGRLPDEDLVELLGAADLFAMLCRDRWMGLEQEGFGIVFLEAAACGVAQVAGRSGGSHEAVADGETGLVVARPDVAGDVRAALTMLLDDPARRSSMGEAARRRAVDEFSYDVLAARLHDALQASVAEGATS